ncbi:DUF2591 family protein [Marinobacterium stanieri]|uniref:DUF2591 family protein n=1 Tax=Marinobacterium stanieri TaxID=49186 RepID=UPI000255A5D4|nr:DUF2591 family protein [Marinobacterium stanieri]
MSKYAQMSNYEITKAVVEITCRGQNIKFMPRDECPITGPVDYVEIETPMGRIQRIDCCSDPSDAWPAICGAWQELMTDELIPGGITGWSQIMHEYDCSKLRAAMIVFLMKQEAA